MATAIEYQKLMTEIVYINLPGPEEPAPGMTGGELLHGFLAELYRIAPGSERAHSHAVQQMEHPLSGQRRQRLQKRSLSKQHNNIR